MRIATNPRPRARTRGLTLIEVMVVITILGLVSVGIAVGVLKYLEHARIRDAETQGAVLRQQAQAWRSLSAHEECPTPERLLKDGVLDEGSRLKDGWETPYVIECEGERIQVRSAGPDRKLVTPDDIVIPAPPSAVASF
jgi:general secretion pathway protein G